MSPRHHNPDRPAAPALQSCGNAVVGGRDRRQEWAAAGRKGTSMSATLRDMLDLELALLRRGLDERLAGSERCTCCNRTPLVGERVYVYASGTIACELCRERPRESPVRTRTVHGPEFGHTMRLTDQRAAA